ncbi:unnamed protein product [Prunus armeniaca]
MTRMPFTFTSAPIELASFLSNWWDEINENTQWQDGIFYALCAAYALVSSVALFQLIRIELRVPEYGWTTQKVFHLMNFIVNGVRAIVFGFHHQVFALHPKVLVLVLLDLPGLLFFSTYTLLVLFWAEIYHQARSLPTDKLRVVYISVNAAMYFIQVCSIFVYLACFIMWFLYIPCCYHNICVWLVCFFFFFPFMCATYISSPLTFQSFSFCQSP